MAALERSSPLVLEHRVADLLSRILGRQLPTVKIYAGQPADGLARAAGADALAYPDRVVFRRDAYDPQSARGLALLGHELTHVARMQARLPHAAPPTPGESAAEEREALDNEREVRRFLTQAGPDTAERVPSGSESGLPRMYAAAPAQPASQQMPSRAVPGVAPVASPPRTTAVPKAALSARDLELPAEAPPAPGLSDMQLRRIKDEIYRDLIDRLRTEFERGA